MIEIVIKIDDERYKDIQRVAEVQLDRSRFQTAEQVIANGTPLPKGHGRLGDLDALEDYFRNVRKELKASDYKNGTEFFVRDEMLLNFQQFIHLCDAIIEGSDAE